jgi:hypothetical protein
MSDEILGWIFLFIAAILFWMALVIRDLMKDDK